MKEVQKLTQALDRSLLRAGERVCVAVSGGADSVALLLALHEEREELGIGLQAAHVHHGLRGEAADADETFVRALCARLDIPLTVVRVDTAERMRAEGEGVEEAARALRYAALRGLMEQGAADVAATAHTLDDQAETVMMKLLRGAWLEGLSGIAPEVRTTGDRGLGPGGRVVRPLLGVRRAEVEAFLWSRGEGWCEDATNADVSLTRNRVRHELMPLLRGFNPAADTMLANAAELARADAAYWEAETARLRPMLLLPGKPVRGGGRAVGTVVDAAAVAIEVERLRALPAALWGRMVRAAAVAVGCRLTFEETAKILRLAGLHADRTPGGKGPRMGAKLELRGGLRVERTARELRLWRQG